jgi:DNA-binding SARP family transcriptional activator
MLGSFEVTDGDRVLELGGLKQRSVLAILLLAGNRVVPLDRLIDQLWGEEPPPQATGSLQAYISNLRRALEPQRAPREPARVLRSRPPGYLLAVDPSEYDAARFERLAAEGHALVGHGQPRPGHELLTEALGLWRGPALAEFSAEPFAGAETVRLEELRAVAVEDRIAADLALGQHATAVPELRRVIAEQPLREQLWGHLMVALYRCGRQGEALAAYQECRRRLGDELGIDPGPALKRLELDVLHQAASLDWRAPDEPTPTAAPSVVPSPPVEPAEETAGAELSSRPLIGRETQVAQLDAALRQAVAGRGRLVLVSGEAGIGKTRLAEELDRQAVQRGAAVLWGRCHEGEGAPAFWPWVQVLRAVGTTLSPAEVEPLVAPARTVLAPLVPEWGVPGAVPPQHGDPGRGRAQLYQAVVNVIRGAAAVRPVVLILEDLHWADVPSLQLVDFLAPQLDGEPLLIVATYRTPEPGTTPALADTLGTVARFPTLERIPLSGLEPQHVGRFIAGVIGSAPDRALVDEVHDRTEGNPFFVTELVRLLQSEGMLGGDRGGGELRTRVPAAVRDVIRRRLSRLPESTNALLSVGAIIGRHFDLDLLARAAGVDDDAILDLVEMALVSGLVVESGEVVGRFAFSHALIRETLYEGLSALRRARVHARVAEGLESLPRPDDAAHAIDLAHHFSMAAPVLGTARALPPVLRGAEVAEALFDHGLAERMARAAIDMGGGFSARLVLGKALVGQRRGDAAEELLSQLGADADTDAERAQVALTRAPNLMFNLGRAGDADAVLHEVHDGIGDDSWREELTLLRAEFFMWTNKHGEALEIVTPFLSRKDIADRSLLRAINAAVANNISTGRLEDSLSQCDRGLVIARQLAGELPFAEPWLMTVKCTALYFSGRITEGAILAEHQYRAKLQARKYPAAASLAIPYVRGATYQGRMRTAQLRSAEVVPLLRKHDALAYLPFALGYLAHAAALLGDLATADAAIAEAQELESVRMHRHGILRAHAWIAAARGETATAQALALEGAESAREVGMHAIEATLLHEAVRLGAAAMVVGRLGEVAPSVDGRLISTFAAHARAVVDQEGAALDTVAAAFAEMGAMLLAAEAATEAVACHRRAGLPGRAGDSLCRARTLAAQCEGAVTPVLATLEEGETAPLASRDR